MEPRSDILAWLVERCLREPASRVLDGEIYCALHNIEDANDLSSHKVWEARLNGEVLVEHRRGGGIDWIQAPPYTTELLYAETLLPDGLRTVCRDPRRVCASALNARALLQAPSPPVSTIFESCRA